MIPRRLARLLFRQFLLRLHRLRLHRRPLLDFLLLDFLLLRDHLLWHRHLWLHRRFWLRYRRQRLPRWFFRIFLRVLKFRLCCTHGAQLSEQIVQVYLIIELLDIMYQNPNETIASLLGSDDFVHAKPLEDEGGEPDVAPGYAEFTI